MDWLAGLLVALVCLYILWLARAYGTPRTRPPRERQQPQPPRPQAPQLSMLPERFVVLDLETTGLSAELHEIIELAAIRVHRDSDTHETFAALIKPRRKIPKRITEITGITQGMVDQDGSSLEEMLPRFLDFIGELPLVAYNADFDMGFLQAAVQRVCPGRRLRNRVSCALKMARRAWPGLRSYRLADMARTGNLSDEDTHRALGDCKRTMLIYAAAAAKLGKAS